MASDIPLPPNLVKADGTPDYELMASIAKSSRESAVKIYSENNRGGFLLGLLIGLFK